MTAVLSPAAPLFLERPAEVGDRVHCGQAGSWLFLIGRVFGVCPKTGRLRVEEEQTGTLVYVDPATPRVFAPAVTS